MLKGGEINTNLELIKILLHVKNKTGMYGIESDLFQCFLYLL
jgi:hypothetical protein